MEFEQIVKRLEWLDQEHRKDKSSLDELTERLTRTEGELGAANKCIKDLDNLVSRLSTTAARIEQFDLALSNQRKEIVKYLDDVEKKRQERQQEIDKRQQVQLDGNNKSIAEMQKTLTEVKRELKTNADEEQVQHKLLKEWENRMQLVVKTVEEIQHGQKVAEDTRRQENKRLVDLQGEVSANRKRLDEIRERNDLLADSLQRAETRLGDVVASEAERKQMQANFIETQVRHQVERDRDWKEWRERLQTMRDQTETMERNLQEWDTAQRALKRAQETYEEIAQKFDRRINEITEMQRLAEDRFRQEWVTFKADDQKRWASYTLSQDETIKDTRAELARMGVRLTATEDLAQTHQDVLQQTKEANEQLFQGLLAQLHELLAAYERIMSTK